MVMHLHKHKQQKVEWAFAAIVLFFGEFHTALGNIGNNQIVLDYE